MIKVSVFYPNIPGAHFDHDYYRDRHLPLIQTLLGESCRSYTIEKGLSGQEADGRPTYVCMCTILSDSVEAFQAGFAPNAAAIEADVPNYTDIAPIMQISTVVRTER